jgi:hypothetical protein
MIVYNYHTCECRMMFWFGKLHAYTEVLNASQHFMVISSEQPECWTGKLIILTS